jgi:hypothetical protein
MNTNTETTTETTHPSRSSQPRHHETSSPLNNGGAVIHRSSGSSSRRSYRQGQKAYEEQLQELEQLEQQMQFQRRKRSSMDPPAALDPEDLPPSPTFSQRALRSASSVAAAAAAAASASMPANRTLNQVQSLYDDPSSTLVGTYIVPTFKDDEEGNNKSDLPYTWEDVVKEAERRRSRQNSSHSTSSSTTNSAYATPRGSNHASPLYVKEVYHHVKGGVQQQHSSSDPAVSSPKMEGMDRRRGISQSSYAAISPMTPSKVSTLRRYQPKSNHRKGPWEVPGISEDSNEEQCQPPSLLKAPPLPFQNNNEPIPPLPLVQTVEVTKHNPDQPAGLFLTKAKNGAVLVHSLTPTSIFRCNNASDEDILEEENMLHPGQEVLSVNEKRVNDPKMAASLISQAKGRLSLRVSTFERQRGFLYCQVKRRLRRGANDIHHHDNNTRARDHGVRFVTTSVDGVRRGTVTDGLVRVTHIDPNGLFASLHPLNRLRMGSIVLTVNGSPVTNARVALEKIMESRNLIEVLHCDERVWREEWVMAGLVKVLFGGGSGQKIKNVSDDIIAEESAFTILTRKADAKRHGQHMLLDQYWVLSWNVEHNEVTLSKVGIGDCAFKLRFKDEVGTCQCDIIDGKMMPPTEDFDVSLFVKSVNNAQREMMTMLQNMLQRAKLESNVLGRSGLPTKTALSTVIYRGGLTKVERIKSCDGLEDLFKEERGCNHEQLIEGVDDLFRRGACKRRSTSALANEPNELFLEEDLGMLYLNEIKNNNSSSGSKLRDFSAQQHRIENTRFANEKRRVSIKSSNGSMFSADLLEEFMNDLEHEFSSSGSDGSSHSNATHSFNESEMNLSPRDNTTVLNESAISLHDRSVSSEASLDNDNAYITGVWRDVSSKYEISDTVLGSGGFGEVKDCYDKSTGKLYVVKTILKPLPGDTVKINLIRNEILLLHEANHPNIVELKDLFEDDKYVHIVMERCAGGDLFDRVVEENPRRIRSINEGMKHEATTANAMRSIVQVLKYLHSKHICHRDIKPEHFLLTTKERETQKIKLIDFGLARKHTPGSEPMSTFTGSPSFVAPEVIDRSYDHMCDCWSTGVTAFFLLTGMLPFDGQNDEETFQIISRGQFSFPSSSIFLSSDAKDFVAKLLVTDPRRRMTAAEALNHPWMQKTATC